MAWFVLFVAGLCEIAWAVGLKHWQGFARPVASAVTVAIMLLSFVLLFEAMRSLPLGTAYAVWTGIGAVGTALFGMFWLGESRDWPRLVCLALIVIGILGLKLLTEEGG